MVKAFALDIKSSTTKLILLKLADNANDSGYCFPSIEHISKLCSIDRRTVQRHIKQLEADGYLTIKQRFNNNKQRSNEYLLHIDSPIESGGGNLPPPIEEDEFRGGTGSPVGAAEDRPESLDLSNSNNKTLCASPDELLENGFNDLWQHWPAKKNKIACKKAFKGKFRGKSAESITNLIEVIKSDITERLRVFEYAADNHDLGKWIKGECWENMIKIGEAPASIEQDHARKASDRLGNELFNVKK